MPSSTFCAGRADAVGKLRISLIVPCFNSGTAAVAAVEAVGRLPLPEAACLEAIVVDDGSTDDSLSVLETALPRWARVVVSASNSGRSGAINLGAGEAHGEYLLLLDADCIPASEDFLLSHMATISAGADASVGDVQGLAQGFWGRYQSAAGRRRALSARGGSVHGLTTANLLMRASAFRCIGGFDSRYRRYGFEDRDFLLRLQRAGLSVRHTPEAAVHHAANVDLQGICRKLRESGSHSSALFRAAHPSAYRELGYAAIDAALHPRRAVLLAPLARAVLPLERWIEPLLHREIVPYRLRAAMVKAVTALAYLDGTVASRTMQSRQST